MPQQDSIWVDGRPARALPLPDRGLDYGDGLFETLLLLNGTALHLDLHLQRLQTGLSTLGFPNCLDTVARQIHSILNSAEFPGQAALRVTLTRGSGPRGYSPPDQAKPRVIIVISKQAGNIAGEMLAPARLALAKIRWGHQPALAGIKHLNRLEQVMAAMERESAEVDEVVMLDWQGRVISVSAANLFIRQHDRLITPELKHCGVRGTRRRLIVEQLAPALGLRVQEAEVTIAQLESAEEVFYCNALVGVRAVGSFGATTWSCHATCTALHKMLFEGLQ